jgi:hypothetical protein
MAEATILQFPRRKVRVDLRTAVWAGNDRLLDLACLSMSLAEGARSRPRDAVADNDTRTAAFLCAGIILGAIDGGELTLD